MDTYGGYVTLKRPDAISDQLDFHGESKYRKRGTSANNLGNLGLNSQYSREKWLCLLEFDPSRGDKDFVQL